LARSQSTNPFSLVCPASSYTRRCSRRTTSALQKGRGRQRLPASSCLTWLTPFRTPYFAITPGSPRTEAAVPMPSAGATRPSANAVELPTDGLKNRVYHRPLWVRQTGRPPTRVCAVHSWGASSRLRPRFRFLARGNPKLLDQLPERGLVASNAPAVRC
jgi:hypothetical protein